MARQTTRRKAENGGSDTRTELLRSAERLIPELGLSGASSRKVASDAGATVASVNYYFGSRDGLITAVVAEHMVPVMRRVAEQIEGGKGVSRKEPVKSIMRIYAETILVECLGDPILREAMSVLFSNPELARRWNRENIDPYIDRIIDAVALHMPGVDYVEVRRRFNLYISCVTGQIVRRMGVRDEKMLLKGLDEFVDFVAPGVLAK